MIGHLVGGEALLSNHSTTISLTHQYFRKSGYKMKKGCSRQRSSSLKGKILSIGEITAELCSWQNKIEESEELLKICPWKTVLDSRIWIKFSFRWNSNNFPNIYFVLVCVHVCVRISMCTCVCLWLSPLNSSMWSKEKFSFCLISGAIMIWDRKKNRKKIY